MYYELFQFLQVGIFMCCCLCVFYYVHTGILSVVQMAFTVTFMTVVSWSLSSISPLSTFMSWTLFAFHLGPLTTCAFWESNILLLCRPPIISYINLSMSSTLISGIPSSTGPSTGTTKNLHLAVLSLCLSLSVHTPKCLILDLLYVFRVTELLLWHVRLLL